MRTFVETPLRAGTCLAWNRTRSSLKLERKKYEWSNPACRRTVSFCPAAAAASSASGVSCSPRNWSSSQALVEQDVGELRKRVLSPGRARLQELRRVVRRPGTRPPHLAVSAAQVRGERLLAPRHRRRVADGGNALTLAYDSGFLNATSARRARPWSAP